MRNRNRNRGTGEDNTKRMNEGSNERRNESMVPSCSNRIRAWLCYSFQVMRVQGRLKMGRFSLQLKKSQKKKKRKEEKTDNSKTAERQMRVY